LSSDVHVMFEENLSIGDGFQKSFFFFSQKKYIAIYRSKCFVVFLENFYFAFIYLFLNTVLFRSI